LRAIPGAMATQHPDNARPPSWDPQRRPFVSFHQELTEVVFCFKELGINEYMWDWEGKHADAAVIDRLLSEHHDYFTKKQLGREKFLTFRIPNMWHEKGYSLLQAMTVILSSEDLARDLGLHNRPLFEVILPLTERADQLHRMQVLFERLAHFKSREFTSDQKENADYLEIIPLVETVEGEQAIAGLLRQYVRLHKHHYGRSPEYIRPFLACSDPALASGLLATVIAIKLALSRVYEFAGQNNIPVYPIAGPGSLPFRGGLTPSTVDRFISEFPGVRTVTVQSAFRYDHPLTKVRSAVSKLERELPKATPLSIDQGFQSRLVAISRLAARHYLEALEAVSTDLQPFFNAVPKRRDRRLHIGLNPYSRSVGNHVLPRAINFTSAFYSIGVPPELIGVGRTLRRLKPADLELLREVYPSLLGDLEQAGRFLNADNLEILERQNDGWSLIRQDVEGVREVIDLQLRPRTSDQVAHCRLSGDALLIMRNQKILADLFDEMANIRKSVG
jgi:phosphoenolpyruvate carboxylase